MFKLLILSLVVVAFVNVEAKSVDRKEIRQRLKAYVAKENENINAVIGKVADHIAEKVADAKEGVAQAVQEIKSKISPPRPEVIAVASTPAVADTPVNVPAPDARPAPVTATAKNANIDADDASTVVADPDE